MHRIACTLLFVCLLPVATVAEEAAELPLSFGFADPDDLSELLDYRLPDWGWRTWDVGVDLAGSGAHVDDRGYRTDRTDHRTALASDLSLYRESEDRLLRLDVLLDGAWSQRRSGLGDNTSHGRQLVGRFDLSGRYSRHPGGGAWFLRALAGAVGTYEDIEIEERYGDGSYDDRSISRTGDHWVGGGVGVGRVRDVTPLVRALRLNERLRTLGRPTLDPAGVQHVARVLAQEYGYRIVFERPDRRFWRDVLEPLLGGEPLDVAEIFYLTEILQEDLDGRRQGAQLAVDVLWYQGGSGDEASYQTVWEARGEYAHNLSLALQFAGTAWASWTTVNDDFRDYHRTSAGLRGDLLWTLADRFRLDAVASGYIDETDPEDIAGRRRYAEVQAEVALQVRIEDRLALRPSVGARWNENVDDIEFHDSYRKAWNWYYALSFQYRLDNVLF